MILQHVSMLTDSNYTRRDEDLIIWGTVEPLCYAFETI